MACGMRFDMAFAPDLSTPGITRIVIDSDPLAVRHGLAALFATPLLASLSSEAQGVAEIVLAEVLNNIVEHAYARYHGDIEVTVQREGSNLAVHLRDRGLPLPGHAIPAGLLPDLTGCDDLPEGGFGWHLIRLFAADLEYARVDGVNHFHFRLPG